MEQVLDCRTCMNHEQNAKRAHAGRLLSLTNEWTVKIKRKSNYLELHIALTSKGIAREKRKVTLRRRRRVNALDTDDESDGFLPSPNDDGEQQPGSSQGDPPVPERPVNTVHPQVQEQERDVAVEQATIVKDLTFRLHI